MASVAGGTTRGMPPSSFLSSTGPMGGAFGLRVIHVSPISCASGLQGWGKSQRNFGSRGLVTSSAK